MKQILGIAKTELQVLFFSPIAWFILVVFMVQSSMSYFNMVEGFAGALDGGKSVYDVTYGLFVQYYDRPTFLPSVLNNLFYYIPLLTMGIMSRELSSGSIKLLFSSPVSNAQIVLGKFFAVAGYGLVMVFIIFLFVLQGAAITPENFDWGFIPVSLLGIFLLICAYAAVGIFMSSLTSYQMVAMLSTLVVLTFFRYIGGFWQDVAFVRDITYWLSMNGRASLFIQGVISSEGFFYFVTVVFLFLALTVLRLRVKREKMTRVTIASNYAVVFAIVIAVAFISSRPVMKKYCDATRFERLTLTQSSQDIISQMDNSYTITTYINLFDGFSVINKINPKQELNDINQVMGPYTRFKPDIKLKYVYYISTKGPGYAYYRKNHPTESDEEILARVLKRYDIKVKNLLTQEQITEIEPLLVDEDFRTVKVIEDKSGKKGVIRYFYDRVVIPTESEISASFKRMVIDDYPKIAFVDGHDERSINFVGDLTYSSFTSKFTRASLYNQGFDLTVASFENPIPSDIQAIVIADPRSHYSEAELANFREYIARGGNVVILGEPFRKDFVSPLMAEFGYKMAEGTLVKPEKGNRADITAHNPTREGSEFSYFFAKIMRDPRYRVSTPSATYLERVEDKGYKATVLLGADPAGDIIWNELQTRYFEEFEPEFNPEAGEERKANAPVSLALEREVGGKRQKIILSADADCFSNQEMSQYPHRGMAADNASYISGIFHWLSDGVSPIDMRRPAPIDNNVKITVDGAARVKFFFMWGIPFLMLVASLIINIRRRAK